MAHCSIVTVPVALSSKIGGPRVRYTPIVSPDIKVNVLLGYLKPF
jgi:hypothetical protein